MTESVACWGAEEPLLTFKCKLVPSVIRAAELRFNTCLHLLQSTLLQAGSILMAADVVPYWRRKRAQKRFYSAHLAGLCKHKEDMQRGGNNSTLRPRCQSPCSPLVPCKCYFTPGQQHEAPECGTSRLYFFLCSILILCCLETGRIGWCKKVFICVTSRAPVAPSEEQVIIKYKAVTALFMK